MAVIPRPSRTLGIVRGSAAQTPVFYLVLATILRAGYLRLQAEVAIGTIPLIQVCTDAQPASDHTMFCGLMACRRKLAVQKSRQMAAIARHCSLLRQPVATTQVNRHIMCILGFRNWLIGRYIGLLSNKRPYETPRLVLVRARRAT